MPTQALIARNSQAITIEGLEGLTMQDCTLPAQKIIQPVTHGTELTDCGKFINTVSKEIRPTLDVVILRIWKVRTYFKNVGDKAPACSSNDGTLSANPDTIVQGYNVCAACIFSKWDEQTDTPPPCKEGYMALCMDYATGEKFLVRGMSTSRAAMKGIISLFTSKSRPPFSGKTHFSTEAVTGETKYWILKASVSLFAPEETARWRNEYLTMVGVSVGEQVEPLPDEAPPVAEDEEGLQF